MDGHATQAVEESPAVETAHATVSALPPQGFFETFTNGRGKTRTAPWARSDATGELWADYASHQFLNGLSLAPVAGALKLQVLPPKVVSDAVRPLAPGTSLSNDPRALIPPPSLLRRVATSTVGEFGVGFFNGLATTHGKGTMTQVPVTMTGKAGFAAGYLLGRAQQLAGWP